MVTTEPIDIHNCTVPPPDETRFFAYERRKIVNLFNAFPLFVVTPFVATHNKGRTLDYMLCNHVAT